MANYILKQFTADTYQITCARAGVGKVWRTANGALAGRLTVKGRQYTAEGDDTRTVFRDLVAQANRVALCGENDAAKAAEALAKHNAATRAKNAKEAEAVNAYLNKVLDANDPTDNMVRAFLTARAPQPRKIAI
jgi:hypothetical protein